MPHTMALVWRLKRVALFPGGQRHSECTQNTLPHETHRGRGYLPHPSTPQVQGGWLIKTTKQSQEDGILRTWGSGASTSSGKRWQRVKRAQRTCLAGKQLSNEQRKDAPCREQARRENNCRACSVSQERRVFGLQPICTLFLKSLEKSVQLPQFW